MHKKDKIYTCHYCNNTFPFKGYSFNHKYCDNSCSSKHREEKRIERDRSLYAKGQLKDRRTIKKFLVEEKGYKCSECGLSEWRDKEITLWVDHIDGNAANNKPSNFRLVCPNCDSQSPTFGGKNYGNGRKARGLPQYG